MSKRSAVHERLESGGRSDTRKRAAKREREAPITSPKSDELLAALAVVKEARQLFGKRVARAIWAQLGVLPLPSMAERAGTPADNVTPSVREFSIEGIRQSAGDETQANALYEVYVQWAVAKGHRPASNTRFGRDLGRLGFRKERRGCVFYQDVTPAPPSPHSKEFKASDGPRAPRKRRTVGRSAR